MKSKYYWTFWRREARTIKIDDRGNCYWLLRWNKRMGSLGERLTSKESWGRNDDEMKLAFS